MHAQRDLTQGVASEPLAAVDLSTVNADVDTALETVVGTFGRRVGAEAALLAVLDGEAVRTRSTFTLNGADALHALDQRASRLAPGGEPRWDRGLHWQRADGGRNELSFLAVDANGGSAVRGALWAAFSSGPGDFNEAVAVAREQARLAALCLRQEVAIQALEHAASHDVLTGCLNRRGTRAVLLDEVARSERHGHSLTVCFLDLDDFKQVNETGGHIYGDRVLAEVGAALRAATRPYDLVGRVGGDEFLVLMPETDRAGADAAMTRLVESMGEAVAAATERRLTVSLGVAEWGPGVDVDELWRRADDALRNAG